MVEIKFRAWDKAYKEWSKYDCFLCQDGRSLLFYDESTADVPTEFEVQQFTGLHDKNGKEIYEGDILKHIPNDGSLYHYKVWRAEGGFCINSFRDDFFKDPKDIIFYSGLSDMQTASFVKGNLEVVGNIFENLEMLKQ